MNTIFTLIVTVLTTTGPIETDIGKYVSVDQCVQFRDLARAELVNLQQKKVTVKCVDQSGAEVGQ